MVKYGDAEAYFTRVKDGKKKPLILHLHGGPHGVTYWGAFTRESVIRQTVGISELYVNYRGSTGYGLNFLESLQGYSGIKDVDDCGELLKKTLEQFKDEIDETRIGVFGGSHGGFLTCFLSGHPSYAKYFRAAAQWNPVTDFYGQTLFTDITDWSNAEALGGDLKWALD